MLELTRREREVLELLAIGLDSPRIADRLGVKVTTVRTLRYRMLGRNACNTAGLLGAWGRESFERDERE